MKILEEKETGQITGILAGPRGNSSVISIPLRRDPRKEKVRLMILGRIGVVPLHQFAELNVIQAVALIEAIYRGLRIAGWKAEDARQILPRGGQN